MYIVQNRNIVAVGKKGPSYKSYKTYYALLKLQKKHKEEEDSRQWQQKEKLTMKPQKSWQK